MDLPNGYRSALMQQRSPTRFLETLLSEGEPGSPKVAARHREIWRRFHSTAAELSIYSTQAPCKVTLSNQVDRTAGNTKPVTRKLAVDR